MKFTTMSTQRMCNTFDMHAAEEALAVAIENLASAQEALYAAGDAADHCASVIQDCDTAIEAFGKFGEKSLSVILAICNGNSNALDSALGLESLSAKTIDTLSAAQKRIVSNKYVAGLENKFTDAVRSFIDKVKEWLRRFVEWMKQVFTSNAQLEKMLTSITITDVNDEKRINGLSRTDVVELGKVMVRSIVESVKWARALDEYVKKSGNIVDGIIEVEKICALIKKDTEAINSHVQMKQDTIKALGWTASSAELCRQGILSSKMGSNGNLVKAAKYLQNTVVTIIKTVDRLNATTGNKINFSPYSTMFSAVRLCNQYLAAYNRGYRTVGFTLLRINGSKSKDAKDASQTADQGEQQAAPETETK